MEVSEAGRVTDVSPLQPLKAQTQMDTSESGSATDVSPQQPPKAPSPMEVSESGRATDRDRRQPAAAAEGALADAGERGGQSDRRQSTAAAEGTDADGGERGGQGDGCQPTAAAEGADADGGERGGQSDRRQPAAAVEGACADGDDAAVVRPLTDGRLALWHGRTAILVDAVQLAVGVVQFVVVPIDRFNCGARGLSELRVVAVRASLQEAAHVSELTGDDLTPAVGRQAHERRFAQPFQLWHLSAADGTTVVATARAFGRYVCDGARSAEHAVAARAAAHRARPVIARNAHCQQPLHPDGRCHWSCLVRRRVLHRGLVGRVLHREVGDKRGALEVGQFPP
eukprot:6653224-Prymnesium_polylepis.1